MLYIIVIESSPYRAFSKSKSSLKSKLHFQSNKAANAGHYPRAFRGLTTTKSLVETAALRGYKVVSLRKVYVKLEKLSLIRFDMLRSGSSRQF